MSSDTEEAEPHPGVGADHAATPDTELVEMRDRWMRSEAEVANVRTRAKRDIEEARRYATQKFATDVVEAADNLRRGIASIPPIATLEPEIITRLRSGFVGVERSFVDLLKRNGIERSDPTGSAYDPQLHQAMSERETHDQAPGSVVEAMSPAWTLNGRLLRPAMVVVAKAPDPHHPSHRARDHHP